MINQTKSAPPDQVQRERALDPQRSVLVQAPAGSGKTSLLTERFLRLLAEVDEPGEVVAITFTNAAAAEMRNRILDELRREQPNPAARRVLERSVLLGWNLVELPAQLRIQTIDSFCRELAGLRPLLSGLGGALDIAEEPREIYRRAARATLRHIDQANSAVSAALETLLLWRDNGWQELEELVVAMLAERDRWMHGFVVAGELEDAELDALRLRLERPFVNAIRDAITAVDRLLAGVPQATFEAIELSRFACGYAEGERFRGLAELSEFPCGPFDDCDAIEVEATRDAYRCLADLVLTSGGEFRKAVNKSHGFPADRKPEKARLLFLIEQLSSIPSLDAALGDIISLPPARYTEEDWQIVRACFTVLRHAAGELRVAFAESGTVDFVEVAQIARRVLADADERPTDAAIAIGDGIRHLLVDEFQDTSRRQHRLQASLISAWPERNGRTCFVVGDPMQSIYSFREADAELFQRVKLVGLEAADPDGVFPDPLLFDFVPLTANFRTVPPLVKQLNEVFAAVFAADDGSGVTFTAAEAAREAVIVPGPSFELHLNFDGPAFNAQPEPESASEAQAKAIVELIRSHTGPMEQARREGGKYRIAVLARKRSALAAVAMALREAEIPFRAIDLENLAARPEVRDALALARALFNPCDRIAWLGVLRAPWCGLSLADLHRLTSDDNPDLLAKAIPQLLAERRHLLSEDGRRAAERVLTAASAATELRAAQPTASLGAWLEQVWLRLGGEACVDAAARANLDLLWSCLDGLPRGEQDLLSPALDAALGKLTALPDPEASAECGVQLMTIHKSKGLEFEVVIVPDLQARSGRNGRKMLSWLERGLARPDASGDVTEFLIAPFQSKGADPGRTKNWVDRVCREREIQEDRRILYVAATRAREELHLFARPAYRQDSNGEMTLCEPAASLLATAWPALGDEIRARFDEWAAAQRTSGPVEPAESGEIESIAAGGLDNLLVMPTPQRPTLLRRLPFDFRAGAPLSLRPIAEKAGDRETQPIRSGSLYVRHEGSLRTRALGNAVHTLLEELARLRATTGWSEACAAILRMEPRVAAKIRATGLDEAEAAQIAAEALRHALNAASDPVGQWILAPHAEARSEASWAGVIGTTLRTVRVDRVFRSGPTPQSEGDSCWWIVDYKTAHAEGDRKAMIPELRRLFAPQIEAYAAVLRKLHGEDAKILAGLYYPRMLLLDWWEPEA
jgi:ATP-dependent exoDNAse (exonuclease V) beta subunit